MRLLVHCLYSCSSDRVRDMLTFFSLRCAGVNGFSISPSCDEHNRRLGQEPTSMSLMLALYTDTRSGSTSIAQK